MAHSPQNPVYPPDTSAHSPQPPAHPSHSVHLVHPSANSAHPATDVHAKVLLGVTSKNALEAKSATPDGHTTRSVSPRPRNHDATDHSHGKAYPPKPQSGRPHPSTVSAAVSSPPSRPAPTATVSKPVSNVQETDLLRCRVSQEGSKWVTTYLIGYENITLVSTTSPNMSPPDAQGPVLVLSNNSDITRVYGLNIYFAPGEYDFRAPAGGSAKQLVIVAHRIDALDATHPQSVVLDVSGVTPPTQSPGTIPSQSGTDGPVPTIEDQGKHDLITTVHKLVVVGVTNGTNGEKGADGKNGLPGGPGGSVVLCCEVSNLVGLNADNSSSTSSTPPAFVAWIHGSNGQDGQDGGNGGNAGNGSPCPPDDARVTNPQWGPNSTPYPPAMWVLPFITGNGGNGGPGGNGGNGGMPGAPGTLQIVAVSASGATTTTWTGGEGQQGQGGHHGKGGNFGYPGKTSAKCPSGKAGIQGVNGANGLDGTGSSHTPALAHQSAISAVDPKTFVSFLNADQIMMLVNRMQFQFLTMSLVPLGQMGDPESYDEKVLAMSDSWTWVQRVLNVAPDDDSDSNSVWRGARSGCLWVNNQLVLDRDFYGNAFNRVPRLSLDLTSLPGLDDLKTAYQNNTTIQKQLSAASYGLAQLQQQYQSTQTQIQKGVEDQTDLKTDLTNLGPKIVAERPKVISAQQDLQKELENLKVDLSQDGGCSTGDVLSALGTVLMFAQPSNAFRAGAAITLGTGIYKDFIDTDASPTLLIKGIQKIEDEVTATGLQQAWSAFKRDGLEPALQIVQIHTLQNQFTKFCNQELDQRGINSDAAQAAFNAYFAAAQQYQTDVYQYNLDYVSIERSCRDNWLLQTVSFDGQASTLSPPQLQVVGAFFSAALQRHKAAVLQDLYNACRAYQCLTLKDTQALSSLAPLGASDDLTPDIIQTAYNCLTEEMKPLCDEIATNKRETSWLTVTLDDTSNPASLKAFRKKRTITFSLPSSFQATPGQPAYEYKDFQGKANVRVVDVRAYLTGVKTTRVDEESKLHMVSVRIQSGGVFAVVSPQNQEFLFDVGALVSTFDYGIDSQGHESVQSQPVNPDECMLSYTNAKGQPALRFPLVGAFGSWTVKVPDEVDYMDVSHVTKIRVEFQCYYQSFDDASPVSGLGVSAAKRSGQGASKPTTATAKPKNAPKPGSTKTAKPFNPVTSQSNAVAPSRKAAPKPRKLQVSQRRDPTAKPVRFGTPTPTPTPTAMPSTVMAVLPAVPAPVMMITGDQRLKLLRMMLRGQGKRLDLQRFFTNGPKLSPDYFSSTWDRNTPMVDIMSHNVQQLRQGVLKPDGQAFYRRFIDKNGAHGYDVVQAKKVDKAFDVVNSTRASINRGKATPGGGSYMPLDIAKGLIATTPCDRKRYVQAHADEIKAFDASVLNSKADVPGPMGLCLSGANLVNAETKRFPDGSGSSTIFTSTSAHVWAEGGIAETAEQAVTVDGGTVIIVHTRGFGPPPGQGPEGIVRATANMYLGPYIMYLRHLKLMVMNSLPETATEEEVNTEYKKQYGESMFFMDRLAASAARGLSLLGVLVFNGFTVQLEGTAERPFIFNGQTIKQAEAAIDAAKPTAESPGLLIGGVPVDVLSAPLTMSDYTSPEEALFQQFTPDEFKLIRTTMAEKLRPYRSQDTVDAIRKATADQVAEQFTKGNVRGDVNDRVNSIMNDPALTTIVGDLVDRMMYSGDKGIQSGLQDALHGEIKSKVPDGVLESCIESMFLETVTFPLLAPGGLVESIVRSLAIDALRHTSTQQFTDLSTLTAKLQEQKTQTEEALQSALEQRKEEKKDDPKLDEDISEHEEALSDQKDQLEHLANEKAARQAYSDNPALADKDAEDTNQSLDKASGEFQGEHGR